MKKEAFRQHAIGEGRTLSLMPWKEKKSGEIEASVIRNTTLDNEEEIGLARRGRKSQCLTEEKGGGEAFKGGRRDKTVIKEKRRKSKF